MLSVEEKGSPRRCGGQGDLLSGSLATFLYWASRAESSNSEGNSAGMTAAYAACLFTKQCASRAFSKNGRSTTTTDMIKEIHPSFEHLFGE